MAYPTIDPDLLDSLNDARAAGLIALADTMDIYREAVAEAPESPLPALPPNVGQSNGRGGISGAISTQGATDNRGGVVSNKEKINTDPIACARQTLQQRTGAIIFGEEITFTAQWLVSCPWDTDIQYGDEIHFRDSESGNISIMTVRDDESRSMQIYREFLGMEIYA